MIILEPQLLLRVFYLCALTHHTLDSWVTKYTWYLLAL